MPNNQGINNMVSAMNAFGLFPYQVSKITFASNHIIDQVFFYLSLRFCVLWTK